MRKSLTLICLFCCFLYMARSTVYAQAQAKAPQECSPAMLDVSALPTPPTSTIGGHVFVLRLQNISPVACLLAGRTVTLVPASNTNNQPRYVGTAAESQPQLIEPGTWAHLFFVWTSRAGPELSCDLYSGIHLDMTFKPLRNVPDIEIRNLWIRACGPLGVTGYRPGEYIEATPIPQDWLDWYGPGGARDFTFSLPTTDDEIASSSPLLSLSAQAKRTMLGDRLFSLRLDFPRLESGGCAFSQLRKRESDGSTVIDLQQCDNAALEKGIGAPAVPPHHEAGVMGLFMSDGNLGFMPEHTGAFEYDVIAPINWGGGKKPAPQYARARVDLIARDPSLPSQVAVLDPLPACTPAQLRIDSLPRSSRLR